jgi:D-alanyl-lipoteichoic acid acyltransferase DltB (MBOAT superfamily)
MKHKIEFRYFFTIDGDAAVEKKQWLFGMIPYWVSYCIFSKSRFIGGCAGTPEMEVEALIKGLIEIETWKMNFKKVYKTVNEL